MNKELNKRLQVLTDKAKESADAVTNKDNIKPMCDIYTLIGFCEGIANNE